MRLPNRNLSVKSIILSHAVHFFIIRAKDNLSLCWSNGKESIAAKYLYTNHQLSDW